MNAFYSELPNDNLERNLPNVITPLNHTINAHKNSIFEVNWYDNDRRIGSVSGDLSACIHDVETKSHLHILGGHSGCVRSIDSHYSTPDVFVTGARYLSYLRQNQKIIL